MDAVLQMGVTDPSLEVCTVRVMKRIAKPMRRSPVEFGSDPCTVRM